jgi:predicted transcriptional regulator
MTEDVISCRMDQSVEQVAQLMRESDVRRLIVLSRDDRPIGIVSLGDLATMTHDTPEVGETLEQISSAGPQR